MIDKNELLNIWEGLKEGFPNIEFVEKTHTYHIDKIKTLSVSSLLKKFYEEFDTESSSVKYADKRGFDLIDVRNAWSGETLISTDKGSDVHLFGEDYAKWKYFGIGEKPKCTCKQKLGIIEFWNDLPEHLVPVAFELQMYSKKYGYCGTADIILYNLLDDTFVIADYKTNKKLTDDKFQKELLFHISPLHKLRQDNFGKYSLQFSFYQILLEELGLNVSERILIFLQEKDKKLYQTFKTKNVTNDLKKWLIKNHENPFKKAA